MRTREALNDGGDAARVVVLVAGAVAGGSGRSVGRASPRQTPLGAPRRERLSDGRPRQPVNVSTPHDRFTLWGLVRFWRDASGIATDATVPAVKPLAEYGGDM
jgi:hypothetical protein